MKGKEIKKEKKKEKAMNGKTKVLTKYQRDKLNKQDKSLDIKW